MRHMTRTLYESAAAPTSHNVTDPAKLNVVCHSKPNLPNQTDSNAVLRHMSGAAFVTGLRQLETTL